MNQKSLGKPPQSPTHSESSLYQQIGEANIRRVITEFYLRAFSDPIIGHFFFAKDREHLTAQQIDFATALLGGPKRYRGKPLAMAHKSLAIGTPHFGRRQVLMAEVLTDLAVAPPLAAAWLALEESLKALIFNRQMAPPLPRD